MVEPPHSPFNILRFFLRIVAFLVGMKVVGAALCVLPLGGCALGIGLVFGGLLYGVCRNPDAYDLAFGAALLGLAMIEVFAFLCIIAAGGVYYL